jgi:chloramphenicol 3-O-phosphotransferase
VTQPSPDALREGLTADAFMVGVLVPTVTDAVERLTGQAPGGRLPGIGRRLAPERF